jgi:hypothetical protein
MTKYVLKSEFGAVVCEGSMRDCEYALKAIKATGFSPNHNFDIVAVKVPSKLPGELYEKLTNTLAELIGETTYCDRDMIRDHIWEGHEQVGLYEMTDEELLEDLELYGNAADEESVFNDLYKEVKLAIDCDNVINVDFSEDEELDMDGNVPHWNSDQAQGLDDLDEEDEA